MSITSENIKRGVERRLAPTQIDVGLEDLVQWEPIYVEEFEGGVKPAYWRASRRGIFLGKVAPQGHFWFAWAFPPASSNPVFLGAVETWFDATTRVQDWWVDYDERHRHA